MQQVLYPKPGYTLVNPTTADGGVILTPQLKRWEQITPRHGKWHTGDSLTVAIQTPENENMDLAIEYVPNNFLHSEGSAYLYKVEMKRAGELLASTGLFDPGSPHHQTHIIDIATIYSLHALSWNDRMNESVVAKVTSNSPIHHFSKESSLISEI